MAAESAVYVFTPRAVFDKAPKASGVYSIFTSKRWVYVGESDDIQQSLFNHLNEPGSCLQRFSPLSFSFELKAPGRTTRYTRCLDCCAQVCMPRCMKEPQRRRHSWRAHDTAVRAGHRGPYER